MWIDILKKMVDERGPVQVAKELGVSRATVDLVNQGKYAADTSRFEKRVMAIYGSGGDYVQCPVLDTISPDTCANKHQLAKQIGNKAGNPETLRLYKACLSCDKRR
jgi:hypothetical protein